MYTLLVYNLLVREMQYHNHTTIMMVIIIIMIFCCCCCCSGDMVALNWYLPFLVYINIIVFYYYLLAIVCVISLSHHINQKNKAIDCFRNRDIVLEIEREKSYGNYWVRGRQKKLKTWLLILTFNSFFHYITIYICHHLYV